MNRLTIVEIDFDNCGNALRQLSKYISTAVKRILPLSLCKYSV